MNTRFIDLPLRSHSHPVNEARRRQLKRLLVTEIAALRDHDVLVLNTSGAAYVKLAFFKELLEDISKRRPAVSLVFLDASEDFVIGLARSTKIPEHLRESNRAWPAFQQKGGISWLGLEDDDIAG